jgi:hypothetical protein
VNFSHIPKFGILGCDTFTLSAYPIGLSESRLDSLPDPRPNALSDRINVYPALYVHTRPNHIPDSCPDQTSTYPALHGLTRPNYLTRSFSDRTSAYPIVPGHFTRLPYPAGLPSDAHSVKLSSTV